MRLPGGGLAVHTFDGRRQEVRLILPSPGLYTEWWQWMFDSESGPFTSPLTWRTLESPQVRDERLSGVLSAAANPRGRQGYAVGR